MQKTIMFVVTDSTGKTPSYEISFPNAGQLLRIEEMKVSLSKYYREMAMKATILGDMALDIVDMQAHFTILCPKLLQEMKVPLLELDISDLMQLREAYNKQFVPWWNDWIMLIGGVPKTEQKTTQDTLESSVGVKEHKKVNINQPGAEDVTVDLG